MVEDDSNNHACTKVCDILHMLAAKLATSHSMWWYVDALLPVSFSGDWSVVPNICILTSTKIVLHNRGCMNVNNRLAPSRAWVASATLKHPVGPDTACTHGQILFGVNYSVG